MIQTVIVYQLQKFVMVKMTVATVSMKMKTFAMVSIITILESHYIITYLEKSCNNCKTKINFLMNSLDKRSCHHNEILCQNKGICNLVKGKPSCLCPYGFEGRACQFITHHFNGTNERIRGKKFYFWLQ